MSTRLPHGIGDGSQDVNAKDVTAESVTAGTVAFSTPQTPASVSQADPGDAGASYVQAELQAAIDLAKANKAALNALITALQALGVIEAPE
jgi:hypothetical protein